MTENIQTALVSIIPFMFAVSLHEAAHAFVANYLGDQTAKMQGRLSLNPIVHADIFGTVIFPIIGFMTGGFLFGWAKPVPVMERNLKWKKYGMCAVALAGPMVNILLGIIFCILLVIFYNRVPNTYPYFKPVFKMLESGVYINVILAAFNLIPLPPLDGSRILEPFLSYEFKQKMRPLEAYSFYILMGLMITGVLSFLLSPAISVTHGFINFLDQLI